jgi:hypothetical protein
VKKTVTKRTRVRMEYTAYPKKGARGFLLDKKLTTLRVLLKERLGAAADDALNDWLMETAILQCEISEERFLVSPLKTEAR